MQPLRTSNPEATLRVVSHCAAKASGGPKLSSCQTNTIRSSAEPSAADAPGVDAQMHPIWSSVTKLTSVGYIASPKGDTRPAIALQSKFPFSVDA